MLWREIKKNAGIKKGGGRGSYTVGSIFKERRPLWSGDLEEAKKQDIKVSGWKMVPPVSCVCTASGLSEWRSFQAEGRESVRFLRKKCVLCISEEQQGSCGLPRWLSGKESNAGDMGLISGSGVSLGEGNDNPLQYSCLGNPMERITWEWATAHGDRKASGMT